MRTLPIALSLLVACSPALATQREALSTPFSGGAACVTHGAATSSVAIATDDPEMRAVAPWAAGDDARLAFTWRGETVPVVPLASGAIRHQVGLKLRAADGCNLVYVMWRLEPKPWIEVQVKSNPGQHTSAECGTNGYVSATTKATAPAPTFADGAVHEIDAQISGVTVSVTVDGAPIWTGDVAEPARTMTGPPGVRSDNVRWDGQLSVAATCAVGD